MTTTHCYIANARLNLLLLGFLNYSETSTIPVKGEKGGNVTLICEYEAKDILDISLNSRSENIDVCQDEECSGRVFKEGNCDVVIKNLSFSDAGKYYLHVYYNNDQTELERLIRTYQLHIHGLKSATKNGTSLIFRLLISNEIAMKNGKLMKLDVLLPNANKVEHKSKNNTEWMEVWSRSNGVQSDRITDRDGNLTILQFAARDTGSYRVLEPSGEPLITVTVRESKEKLHDTDKDQTDDTKYHIGYWILPAGLSVVLVLLALMVTLVMLHKRLHKVYLQWIARWGKGGQRTGDQEGLGDLEAMGSPERLGGPEGLDRTPSDITA